jgi:ATP-dependent RNA helicase DHX29
VSTFPPALFLSYTKQWLHVQPPPTHKMAGGNKKKKTKPAANPARAVATTSIVSKTKAAAVEDVKDSQSSNASGASTPQIATKEPGNDASKTTGTGPSRELHELSPEELEAQLEASELQQFVEQNAAKVRKDSTRQSSRLETDKRLLRTQADFLSVKDWLPEELMQQILEYTLAEFDAQAPVAKKNVGDDLLSKVWALRCCLLDVGIPLDRVNDVLKWLISHPPSNENGVLWGLSEALDWLSLHCSPGELADYDFQRAKSVEKVEHEQSLPEQDELDQKSEKHNNRLPSSNTPAADAPADSADDVSDLESDLEPDELLSVYLRTKANLYELEPDADELKKTKRGRSVPGPAPRSARGRKLHMKLRKIESDMLFDLPQAEAQWMEKKIVLSREAAERRKLQLPSSGSANSGRTSPMDCGAQSQNGVSDEAEKLGLELLQESQDQDGDDMLSGMFSSHPGPHDSPIGSASSGEATNVTIRDFGNVTGMNPKRVLEEACKARDPQVKLVYKQVSETTYASRHSVGINWSREQELVDAAYLPAVEVKSKPRSISLKALHVATPGTSQSEAYIATVSLFIIFSGSPKEEKAHMRLPPAFRNLWDELVKTKQDHNDSADRETVKALRKLIEESTGPEDDDDEEVVFKAGSRHRSTAPSGVATPVTQEIDQASKEAASLELMGLWARKISTPSYQRMLLGRMNLPIFHYRTPIIETISRHQVTILVSETGSGKSTQLPAFILEHELSQGRHCKVYCTEPRRISAISLAHRVSEEMGEHKNAVGTPSSLVGYSIRLESQTSASTRLVYATTGIVLRMLENAEGLADITHLVIDEVHERTIDSDFLLIILRSLLQRRPDLKVILMSATVNAQRFSNYLHGAPVVDVPGRTFQVKAMFLEDAIELTGHTNEDASEATVDDDADDAELDEGTKGKNEKLTGYSKRTLATLSTYNDYIIDYSLIVKLIQRVAFSPDYQQYSKALLVFLPGLGEIRRLHDILTSQPAFARGWRVHALHSSFSSEDQQAAFDIPPPGMRKIVLATNIAETGITIPDVTCVIDTGRHKEMRFDEKRQMSRLILSFIAKANAKQRRGRAGRVQEGLCFHLFTKHRHDELMAENQTPEMLRLSLQDLVMRVKICKLGGIEDALSQALDPPSSRNIRRAIDALIEVDALTSNEELTPLGQQLAKLPLDAQLGKLILLGSIFGCLDSTLTIAAALTSKSPFLNPMGAKRQADTVRLGYKRGDSDLLTVFNAYCAWRKVCSTPGLSERQFCDKNFLSSQNLANIEDLKGQLLSSLVEAGFVNLGPEERAALSRVRPGSRQRNFVVLPKKYCQADENDTLIQSVVAWSFYPKIIKQDGKGWKNIANNQSLALHPASVNKMSLAPDVKLLSFYSIMQSSSRFTNAQETTAAPELALVLLAGEATFNMFSGVIIVDGNRLRYKVKDSKTMIALKTLRTKLRELLARSFRAPGKDLTGKHAMWMDVLMKMFEKQRKA